MAYLCASVRLPALSPDSASLLTAFNDERVQLHDLTDRIATDAALTGRLLRTANSPFYGVSGQIASVDEAVTVIGTAMARSLLISSLMMRHFSVTPWNQMDLKAFWEESIACAVACRVLANRTLVSPSAAFATGLLHQIGALVLCASPDEESYLTVFKRCEGPVQLNQAEIEAGLASHAQVGAELLQQWGLPEPMIRALLMQYSTEMPESPDMLTEVLRCAIGFAQSLYQEESEGDYQPGPYHAQLLKLPDESIPALTQTMKLHFNEFRRIMSGAQP